METSKERTCSSPSPRGFRSRHRSLVTNNGEIGMISVLSRTPQRERAIVPDAHSSACGLLLACRTQLLVNDLVERGGGLVSTQRNPVDEESRSAIHPSPHAVLLIR